MWCINLYIGGGDDCMKKEMPFKLTIKDLKKIKFICSGFEELCEKICFTDALRPANEVMTELQETVREYNEKLERGDF